MKYIFLSATIALLASCTSFKQVGSVNMISTRNVENGADYTLIRSYMGASKKELKKTRATTLDEAINDVVKNTPGGEHLRNVKIYLVNGTYFAVEGDVWGTTANQNMRGFKIGEMVTWKDKTKVRKGKITDLKSAEVATVTDDDGKTFDVKYTEMSKTAQ